MSGYAFAAAFALLWLGGPAGAQLVTSTSDRVTGPGRSRGDAARTDPIFRRMIACLVEREPSATRNLLATIPGSDGEARILWRFQSRIDHCLPGAAITGVGFSWDLLRGGVAEVHYRHAFPAGLPAEPAAAPDLAASWSRPRQENGRSPASEMLHATARCVVLREPAAVTRMLASAPFSAGETRALNSLQGALSACLDAGTRFTASRQSLRGLLAEAGLHYGRAYANGFASPSPR